MPGLKRTSTSITPGGAKRPAKKKYRATVSVPRNITLGANIIARKQKCYLRYADTVRLSGDIPAKGTGFTKYSANGMYDPQVSLGGHQPRGYDQLAAIYDEYQVRRATVEVTFSAFGADEWLPFISIRPSDSETPDLTNILEGPDRVVAKTTIKDDGNSLSSKYLKLSVDPIKWLGNSTYDNEATRAATNSNPTDKCTFYIGACNTNPTATKPIVMDVTIVITYEAEFMNPKTPGES